MTHRRLVPALILSTLALLRIPGADAAPALVQRVGPEEFKKLADSGQVTLLDVRTPTETRKGQIPGSSSIDMLDPAFATRVARVRKDLPLLVYCASGGRSAKVAETVKGMGFAKVYDLAGGLRAWSMKGFPITPPSADAKDAGARAMTPADFGKLLASPAPVLADFHTTWCLPCRKMAPVVDRLATSFGKRATVVRVDTDTSRELADTYRIEGVPVFILFDQGKEVWRGNGVLPEEELRRRVEERIR